MQFVISPLFAQNKTIDSLLSLVKKDRSDTNKAIHSNLLCWEYRGIGEYARAFQFGNSALELSKRLNFKRGIATSYNNIGGVYYNRGDYDKALENYFYSLKIRKSEGDKRGIAATYNSIGTVYDNRGDLDKALENYFAALKIRDEIGDKEGIASSYVNIALIYYNQGYYEKALENNLQGLKSYEELGNKNGISACFSNLALIYYRQGNYDKALESNYAALKIRRETGDKQGIAGSYNNIGDIYKSKGNNDLALENYFASLKIFEEIGTKQGVATSCLSIAAVYADKSNYSKSQEWYEKGLLIAIGIGEKQLLEDAYKGLSNISEKTGNFTNAYKYHRLYSQYKDSIFNEKSIRQIAEMQTKYETEKKDKENKLLTEQNLLQKAKIDNRTLVLVIMIGLLFFTIIISLLLYYRYKSKQASLMKQELHHQQQLRAKAIIDSEEKERRRIAQELHDGLGQLLSTAKLNISVLENMLPSGEKHFQNALSLIDNSIDEVRTISHNMMPSALIRLGLLSALRELARKINDSNKIKVDLNADFDERLNESNEVAIYRIIQEVTNNMIKYSKASTIQIRLSKNKENLRIEIRDNGVGFDTSLIEESAGVGWRSIYARTALLNGMIDVVSEHSAGTTVNIHCPGLFSEQEHSLSSDHGSKK